MTTPMILQATEATEAANLWPIIASVAGLFAMLVGGLVMLNLKTFKSLLCRLQDDQALQAKRLGSLERQMSLCQVACNDKFTSKEDWVRAEGYTRHGLEQQTAMLNRMDGKLDFVKLLPEMGAAMGKEIGKAITAETNRERHT